MQLLHQPKLMHHRVKYYLDESAVQYRGHKKIHQLLNEKFTFIHVRRKEVQLGTRCQNLKFES